MGKGTFVGSPPPWQDTFVIANEAVFVAKPWLLSQLELMETKLVFPGRPKKLAL